jgi:hypothetical protein
MVMPIFYRRHMRTVLGTFGFTTTLVFHGARMNFHWEYLNPQQSTVEYLSELLAELCSTTRLYLTEQEFSGHFHAKNHFLVATSKIVIIIIIISGFMTPYTEGTESSFKETPINLRRPLP